MAMFYCTHFAALAACSCSLATNCAAVYTKKPHYAELDICAVSMTDYDLPVTTAASGQRSRYLLLQSTAPMMRSCGHIAKGCLQGQAIHVCKSALARS